jgi:putative transcriptional regulator
MKMICKLPELMRRENLNQQTLAVKAGLSPTTVGKLYRGHFDRVDTQTIKTLCRFFKLKSIAELFEIEYEEGGADSISAPTPPQKTA